MRPFRIGIALSLFPPVVGGAELLLLELARRWVRRGHATTVFTRNHPDAPTHETIEGIAVDRSIRTVNVGPLFGLSFVASLIRTIRRHRDDFDVLVFGNGHVGRALVQVLGALPARVTWVDEREEDFPASVPANVAVVATDLPEAELNAAPHGVKRMSVAVTGVVLRFSYAGQPQILRQ